jgi:hypothetical protein
MERDHPSSARDAYWQKDQEGRFALYEDGQERAVVDPDQKAVSIHYEGAFTADLTMPDYVCVFDEAENRLGLPRIDDVRGKDGSPDPEVRRDSEFEADLARDARTPDQWARAYAARSYHLLTLNGVDRELSDAESQTGQRLAAVVAALDGQDPDARLDVQAHHEQAKALLSDGIEDQPYGSASLACEGARRRRIRGRPTGDHQCAGGRGTALAGDTAA